MAVVPTNRGNNFLVQLYNSTNYNNPGRRIFTNALSGFILPESEQDRTSSIDIAPWSYVTFADNTGKETITHSLYTLFINMNDSVWKIPDLNRYDWDTIYLRNPAGTERDLGGHPDSHISTADLHNDIERTIQSGRITSPQDKCLAGKTFDGRVYENPNIPQKAINAITEEHAKINCNSYKESIGVGANGANFPLWAKDKNYLEYCRNNKAKCDPFMNWYCSQDKYKNESICSCITSNEELPACYSRGNCRALGYKTKDMTSGDGCDNINIVDCSIYGGDGVGIDIDGAVASQCGITVGETDPPPDLPFSGSTGGLPTTGGTPLPPPTVISNLPQEEGMSTMMIVAIALLVFVLIIGGFFGYYYYKKNKLKKNLSQSQAAAAQPQQQYVAQPAAAQPQPVVAQPQSVVAQPQYVAQPAAAQPVAAQQPELLPI